MSSFQWLHDKIAQREASGERAYLTVGLCDLKSLLDKADAAEEEIERLRGLLDEWLGKDPDKAQIVEAWQYVQELTDKADAAEAAEQLLRDRSTPTWRRRTDA